MLNEEEKKLLVSESFINETEWQDSSSESDDIEQ